jgi:tetratricopeptide (TPR) repeat protein
MLEGQNISHYELSEKLGEGGMGVVYKAWDRKLNRFVALKFLSGSWADSAEQVTRFQVEAQAISALNHPNIATIYEIDEAGGHCFLALEYLPGGTLKTALDQLAAAGQQLSVEQGLEYALQLTEAVAHAHSHGVIHRDIKSANALFTETGAVKLTDFGLAKLARGSNVTQSGSVMGTPAAMSPEQAQGQETDERSDVFSLGVIMFELFSGELPFRGENSLAVLHQIVNVTAPLLGQRRSGIPVALERIVAKALERDREERYQSAANLAADLRTLRRELLFGSTVQRSSLETVAIGTAPVRRRRGPPLKRTLGAAAACVVLGSAGWLAWPTVRARTVSWFRAQSLPAEKRLAILPFRIAGGDSKSHAFVDGLREVVISKLTRIEHKGSLIVVVSPDEVQAKEVSTAAEAGKRLGANLVMTGNMIQTGGQSQLIVRLEDPGSSTLLPNTETIDLSQPNLMAEAEKVVRMLELELSAGESREIRAGDSPNPEATRFYVEGRGYRTAYNFDLAIGAFRDATGKDPNFGLAWAGLAEVLWQKYKTERDPALLAEAVNDATLAVRLNSGLAAVHIAMSQVLREQGKAEAAEQELQAALKIEPSNVEAFRELGLVYENAARNDQAEALYQKTIDMRPNDPAGYRFLGIFYFNRNQQDLLPKAELNLQRAINWAPDSPLANSNLCAVYVRSGRYNDAIEQCKRSVTLEPNARGYTNLGNAYYSLKQYGEAVQPFQQAVNLAQANYQYWGNLGDAYRWAGVHEKANEAYRYAIRLLEKEIDRKNAQSRIRLAVYYASVYALDGNRASNIERSRALSEATGALASARSSYVLYRAALVYEQVHDRDKALELLNEALLAGQSPAEVQASPVLEQLRKEKRFLQMTGPRPKG